MKRFALILVVALTWCGALQAQEVAGVSNQQQLVEVIYKTDGSLLRGTIVEQIPNVSYTIVTTEGRRVTVDALSIEKITKEPMMGHVVTENFNHNYYYNPYINVKYDENGNAILPMSPSEAMWCSLICPGLGQILENRQPLKGLLLMAGSVAGILSITVGTEHADPKWEDIVGFSGLALFAGSYLYSLIDAPLYARSWNVEHGFPANGNISMSVVPVVGVGGYYGVAPHATVGLGATVRF